MSDDWAEGHDMEALPPDPFTAQRYFTCRNCRMRGHIDPNGVTSGEATHQPCTNPSQK
jgi:hypothetical protein